MDTKKNRDQSQKNATDPLQEQALKAHREADRDIAADPDLSLPRKKSDSMDEGELARLGGDKTDLA